MLTKIHTDVKNNAPVPCHTPTEGLRKRARLRQNSKQSLKYACRQIQILRQNKLSYVVTKKSPIATYLPQQGQHQSERVLGTRFVSSSIIHGHTDL